MILEKLSVHLLEIVIGFMSIQELKYCQMVNHFFSSFILNYRKKYKKLNLTLFPQQHYNQLFSIYSKLTKIYLIITTTDIKELKKVLICIPKTVISLKLQLNFDLITQQDFYKYLSRYHSQLQTLKLYATGPNILQTQQKQILFYILSINVKFLHNRFYQKMASLSTFKLVTVGVSKITNSSIQNYLFYALFYFDELCLLQPTITKIQFDQLTNPNLLAQHFIQPDNFQLNTNVTSVTIKQYDQEHQLNLTQSLNHFSYLFGPQIMTIKLTQHVNQHSIMSADCVRQFLKYFTNLKTFQFNIYNISYEIMNFSLDDISKLGLYSLGLSSLKSHQSHFASLLSQLPSLRIINLDFTHIDDDCLLIINSQCNIEQIRLRGCRRLTNQSLIPFFEKQRNLKYLDIRGVIGFSKKAFRLLIKNNRLQKISISDNKINNTCFLDLLTKNSFCLEFLNIGDLMQNPSLTNEVFLMAEKMNLKLLNLTSLQIQFTPQLGFSIKVLPSLLQLVPYIEILSLKINVQHFIFILEQLQNYGDICNSLQKLSLSCFGYIHFTVGKRDVSMMQKFRNKMKRLDSFSLNVCNMGNDMEKIFLNSVLKETKGHDLRFILVQQNIQYIV